MKNKHTSSDEIVKDAVATLEALALEAKILGDKKLSAYLDEIAGLVYWGAPILPKHLLASNK